MDGFLMTLALPSLFGSAYSDLRELRIPNSLVLVAVFLFIICAPFSIEIGEIVTRLIIGSLCLMIGFIAFSFNLFGAGDAKLLTLTGVFVPSDLLPAFGFSLGIFILFCGAILLALRRVPALSRSEWRGLSPGEKFPLAVAIAPSYATVVVVVLLR